MISALANYHPHSQRIAGQHVRSVGLTPVIHSSRAFSTTAGIGPDSLSLHALHPSVELKEVSDASSVLHQLVTIPTRVWDNIRDRNCRAVIESDGTNLAISVKHMLTGDHSKAETVAVNEGIELLSSLGAKALPAVEEKLPSLMRLFAKA